MTKYCLENEKVKREFYKRQAVKKQEKTIRQIAKAVEKYEEFIGYENFKLFNYKRAEKYVKYLREQNLSLNTINSYLRHLRGFLEWLSFQTGYKSRINFSDIELLSLSNNELNSINKKIINDYPTFEQAKVIFSLINPVNEVDMRDKALFALAVLTGMRADSLMKVSIGTVNLEKMEILQKNAKFGKDILTKIFNFDDEMQACFIEWYGYLKEIKLFGNTDPLFPKTKHKQTEENLSFVCNEIDSEYWQSYTSIHKIFKQRAINAGIPEFSPHKYRHLSVHLALQKCKDGQEIKAVSQHFGHEDVITTFQVYGNMKPYELSDILEKINNNNKTETPDDELIKLTQEIVSKVRSKK